MAVFLGAKGGDILAWRNVSEVVNRLKGQVSGRMSRLLPDGELALMRGLKGRLDEEASFEEGFFADYTQALDELDAAGDGLIPLLERINRLAVGYFERRRSVVAFHGLCTAIQDSLVCRVLRSTEEWMEQNGFGHPPAPYCWFALGSLARLEGSLAGDIDSLLVYGETSGEGGAYFVAFSRRAVAVLEGLGMKSRAGITPVQPFWRGSIAQWRKRVVEGVEGGGRSEVLVALADLRPIFGAEGMAAEMSNLVGSMLEYFHGAFRDIARAASELPIGLDFFGRLRVERSGAHRGEFGLEQFALTPLITNVRIMAIKHGVADTGTVGRIKGLLEKGCLGVDLAERLLMAWHDIASRKAVLEIRGGKLFFNPEELAAAEERDLKSGLEAVVNLQRIVYQSFGEQG